MTIILVITLVEHTGKAMKAPVNYKSFTSSQPRYSCFSESLLTSECDLVNQQQVMMLLSATVHPP